MTVSLEIHEKHDGTFSKVKSIYTKTVSKAAHLTRRQQTSKQQPTTVDNGIARDAL